VIGSHYWENLQKRGQDQLNLGSRLTARDLQDALGSFVFDDGASVSLAGRICGGVDWSLPGGANQVNTTAGLVAYRHGGDLTDIVSGVETVPTTVFANLDADSHTFADNASGNPRIDTVILTFAIATDTVISQPQKAGAPENDPIRWGWTATSSVLQGTPAASPVAPSLSTAQMAVYDVYIPNGTTSANFATNAVVTERAPSVGPNRLGGGHPAFTVEVNEDDAERNMLVMERSDGAQRMRFRGRFTDPGGSADSNLDFWPFIERPVGLPAGENTSKLYPMVNPGGREWPEFFPFGNGTVYQSVDNGDMSFRDTGHQVQIQEAFELNRAVPVPARGLELISASISYDVDTAFDGTITTQNLILIHHDSAGSPTTLDTQAMTLGSVGARVDQDMSGLTPIVIGEGESLSFRADVDLGADGTTGLVKMYGAKLTFREGRV
jgi:hypothetical protein